MKSLLYEEAVRRLDDGLRTQLPGPAAQARLAPQPRRQWPAGFNPAAHLVLTVRSDMVQRHRGQVSLPGGVVEPGETFEQAALREAHEEIALPVDADIRLLGALTPLDIPISGFRLHPVVAATPVHQPLVPSDGEVARILEVCIDDLLDPTRLVHVARDRDGLPASVVPTFQVGGAEIWGATAMVLSEFLSLLGWMDDSSV